MGGLTTQELARRRPDLVARMILGGTAAYPITRRRAVTRLMFWLGRAGARLSRSEMATASSRVLLRTRSLDPKNHRWMHTALLRRDPTLYYEAGAAILRFDSRSWIGRLTVPALVIVPTDDQLIAPAAQHELASLLPAAEVIELVGARHEAVLNRGDEIVKAILSFSQ